jgi:hypothetical protein
MEQPGLYLFPGNELCRAPVEGCDAPLDFLAPCFFRVGIDFRIQTVQQRIRESGSRFGWQLHRFVQKLIGVP